MGKKSKCCPKSSTSVSCCKSSSSSSSSSISSSSISSFSSCSSSNTYGYCCPQYPKCKNKCAPIYYPNNYVGQYPCNPCNPPKLCPPYPPNHCPPYPPNHCPSNSTNYCPPNPPNTCSPFYNTFTNILVPTSTTTTTLNNAYTLFLVNPTGSGGIVELPTITSLANCCYKKMFIFTNISITNSFSLTPPSTSSDTINGLPSYLVSPQTSVTLYSSFVGGLGYWSLI